MPGAKSLFGKVHPPLTGRLHIRRIMIISMNVSLFCIICSWSLVKQRFRINHPSAHSATHLWGSAAKATMEHDTDFLKEGIRVLSQTLM